MVLDLTGSLYLGLRHTSAELGGWDALTAGVPAALDRAEPARSVAARLAGLVGAEAGLLFRSTLHAFLDLFNSCPGDAVLVDAASYPVGRWPLAGRRCAGVLVRTFPHHDPAGLDRCLRALGGGGRRPLVLADGYCTGCGRAAPVAGYLETLRPHGGVLVLDDTQALGILGRHPDPGAPYGHGGGGTVRWTGAAGPVLLVDSLTKGFGAPLAVVAGPTGLVEEIRTRGPTRVHSSAPTAADLRAADRALTVNEQSGDRLRARLLWLVRRFRRRLTDRGVRLGAGEFPVQRLEPTDRRRAAAMCSWLGAAGLRSLVTVPPCWQGAAVTVVLTATLSAPQVDWAADLLAEAAHRTVGTGAPL
ncbi:pyridoxal phosphate-dependent aminotransferase family protein [Modestobacter excelsi]|uniref:pyridoxal phosphate-dependent aminotransferase family protein n=1 Tax=Modestobacter excelsi TaxID=2213161 RepID=UPI00110D082E|nr:pyridoxal phosphate-dependent aminotransferase family protein [Modestobacter excelsi]